LHAGIFDEHMHTLIDPFAQSGVNWLAALVP